MLAGPLVFRADFIRYVGALTKNDLATGIQPGSSFCGEEGDTKLPRIAEEGSGGGGGPNIIWNLANCGPREI